MTRNPRYRGLRPHPEKLGVVPLESGEASRPIRVRAAVEVLDWLGKQGAAEVGRLMTLAYEAAHKPAEPKSPGPVLLVPGLFAPSQPHHTALIDELNSGSRLTQTGETFQLERPDGTRETIQPKEARYLLEQGILVVTDDGRQAKASTSQTPEERRRDTKRAPGRRRA